MENISGIYCIQNSINNKKYIGSSNNIGYRISRHLGQLKKGNHINEHLQHAVNKDGITNFKIYILEECEVDQLLIKEQFHINIHDWSTLYNKSKITTGGGGDYTRKPLYLLDLLGNKVQSFDSGCHLAKFLNRPLLSYKYINTPAISSKKYRIVTPDFYDNNLDIILSWKPYSRKPFYKRTKQPKIPKSSKIVKPRGKYPIEDRVKYPKTKIPKHYFNKIIQAKNRIISKK